MSDNRGGQKPEVADRSLEVGGQSLDLVIDRAARAMLDVEPPADLRARVIAQIDQKDQHSRLGIRIPAFSVVRFGVLIAAAAVLVLAVVLARWSEPTVRPAITARAVDVQLPNRVEPAPNVIQAAPPARVAADSQQTRRVLTSSVADAAVADSTGPASAVEPMAPIAPIAVAAIEQSTITPDPIAVRPLNPITEVQIAPLTPPDRRD